MTYSLSFTSGGLLFEESKQYIAAIEDLREYLMKKEEVEFSVIKTNSEKSQKRIKRELDKRLRNLNQIYLERFAERADQDRKIIVFLAICKTYEIITEFCLEVVYKKWKSFDNDLSPYDFEYFLSAKLSEEKYNSLTQSTIQKLGQVALKMLRDVGIFSNGSIVGVKPSPKLRNLILKENDKWFMNCILASPNDV